jgi:hypothetical protein
VIDDLISKFNISVETGIGHLQPYITDQTKRCSLYFDQYEGYHSTALIVSYVSHNELDQRPGYQASFNLVSAKAEELIFTK